MKSEYLFGVNKIASSFPNLSIIGNGQGTWYAGAYKDVKSNSSIKEEVIKLTNTITKQKTSLRDWEWHHVVETQHISQINNSNIYQEEWFNMPTILISKREHKFLSQNFNNNAFRELSTIGVGRKKQLKESTLKNKVEREKRIARIENLRRMYLFAYSKHPTLKKVANNVFNYQLTLI